MKAPPESTKHSLTVRLNDHARNRWPELSRVDVSFRANFAYVDGRYPDTTTIELCCCATAAPPTWDELTRGTTSQRAASPISFGGVVT